MTVQIAAGGLVELSGTCPGEDAERLLQALLTGPGSTVDWRGCRGAHTAVVQVLLAAKPRLRGPPADPRLERWVEPALSGHPDEAR